MQEIIKQFATQPFINALRHLFAHLTVPISSFGDAPFKVEDVLKNRIDKLKVFINQVYIVGLVNDDVFVNKDTINSLQQLEALKTDYNGLLILGVTLNPRPDGLAYTRSQLADLTRAFNQSLPQTPVVVVFKQGNLLSLANAERTNYKQEWREGEKVGKVTLLKDINIEKPHAAHQRILLQLTNGKEVKTFEALYKAWQKVFDTKELNDKFYEKLFNWYLWALPQVKFPQKREEEADMIADDVHQSESLIRMLTRLLFVWFMKEKGLISKELFEYDKLTTILKDFNNTSDTKTIYYKAILQNLFFATLNKPIEDRKLLDRGFNPKEYGDPLVYRYADSFQQPDKILSYFENIPFLNGGLFDCLDKKNEIRLDGFTTKPDYQPMVPDNLFFGTYNNVDLSGKEAYDDKKRKQLTVYGLIDILHQYKFTIEENTPLEEEIALDPELLGKVFENLLASYNPETKTTARKQTGSFYTPREIVNYMVDESLIAYLKNHINDEDRLRQLFNIEIANHETTFTIAETKTLLTAIQNCKILDPACGSGAFPMGVLQKLIHVIGHLDPENKIWFDMVVSNFPSVMQSTVRTRLQKENWNYVRKLGIIQECIYGVDIQPIAIQISKLRFFISLLVDQTEKPNEPNRGYDPLPNLDFKLVAANTLIGAPPTDIATGGLFADPFFDEFDALTTEYFNKHTPAEKKEKKEAIIKLIDAKVAENKRTIQAEIESGRASKKAIEELHNRLKIWSSYGNLFKYESVGFFETKYFFPKVKDGFDVVIGNPPYLGSKEIGAANQEIYGSEFGFTDDMYNYFFHRGFELLAINGCISYITPNTFLTLTSKKNLRNLIVDNVLNELFLVGYVFSEAYVDTVISILIKTNIKNYEFKYKIADQSFANPIIHKANIEKYRLSPDFIFYPPSSLNVRINSKYSKRLNILYSNFKEIIHNQKKIKSNYDKIIGHRADLKPNDLTLLGLVAEGSQGLVTGNNSKYIAYITDSIKADERILDDLKSKLLNFVPECNLENYSKHELYHLAEDIKSKHKKPDCFGKFFIYKSISVKDVRQFKELTLNEQNNGSELEQCWVFYARGNEDGNKWNVPFAEAINWTFENVEELKAGIKTNSRWQGSEFFNETGFGWVDYFTNDIKAFYVEVGPYSKNVVKFHSMLDLSDKYFTALLNSKFITYYVKNFISNTHTLQINDGKLIPIIIPSDTVQKMIIGYVDEFVTSRNLTLSTDAKNNERKIDNLVYKLYELTYEEVLVIDPNFELSEAEYAELSID